jgi:hypothetical protein
MSIVIYIYGIITSHQVKQQGTGVRPSQQATPQTRPQKTRPQKRPQKSRPAKRPQQSSRPINNNKQQSRPQGNNRVDSRPHLSVMCPAAMLCVPKPNCDFKGVITEITLNNLPPELEALRVPYLVCIISISIYIRLNPINFTMTSPSNES